MIEAPLHLKKVARKLDCGHYQLFDRVAKPPYQKRCQICWQKQLESADTQLAQETFVGTLPSYQNDMHIYVSTPNGRRYHGKIEDDNFVRTIPGNYVRWSDKSFCINVDALRQISHTKSCIFKWMKASEVEIRSIPTKALEDMERKTNEYGEVNIRIPIEDCELVEVKKRPKPKTTGRVKKLLDAQEKREKKKESDQQPLL